MRIIDLEGVLGDGFGGWFGRLWCVSRLFLPQLKDALHVRRFETALKCVDVASKQQQ
jgi:hypothetical protein